MVAGGSNAVNGGGDGFESGNETPDTTGDDGVHAKLLNSPTRRSRPKLKR